MRVGFVYPDEFKVKVGEDDFLRLEVMAKDGNRSIESVMLQVVNSGFIVLEGILDLKGLNDVVE